MELFPMNATLTHNLLADPAADRALAAITIRPARPDDVDAILEMHERLSANSIYNRYHSPRLPSRREIEQICSLAGNDGHALVATTGGKIIGMAYYVASTADTAETAFLVEDRFQGQGLGKRLMRALARRALAQGIRFLDAYVLPTNRPMIRLFQRAGKLVHDRRSHRERELRVQLGI
jgi:RimJ/RimL family protein N-acetyltransferase